MIAAAADYGGSIPDYYDACLGPAWFDAFGAELAQRLPAAISGDVLEIACGTGLVTRRLHERLAGAHRLVASDISPAMLDYARNKLVQLPGIEWREADAAHLPFADGEFGAVACAFGLMFVPDKRAALKEIHRVLASGGLFVLTVWDRLEQNPAAAANARVVAELFPGDAEVQLTTPYEMHDMESMRHLLEEAGLQACTIEKKRIEVNAVSARTIALGQIRGTPRSLLLQKRGVSLDDVVDRVATALSQSGGADPWVGTATAIVIEARKAG